MKRFKVNDDKYNESNDNKIDENYENALKKKKLNREIYDNDRFNDFDKNIKNISEEFILYNNDINNAIKNCNYEIFNKILNDKNNDNSYKLYFSNYNNYKIIIKNNYSKIIYDILSHHISHQIYNYNLFNWLLLYCIKYNDLYVSGNEIENITIKFNHYYQNYIVDIFIWNTKKYYYNFLKFNFVITKNNIHVKSIDIINNKKNTIIKNIGNYAVFLPKKNQDINNFKLENEYLNKSIIRNKWINPN